MEGFARCRSWDEAEVHLTALINRVEELERQLRHAQKQLDTAGTPLYKRIWFRIDGWPAWYIVASRRAWRPWHRAVAYLRARVR